MKRIKWQSKITDVTGQGERIYSEEIAQQICTQENEKWPDILHWVEYTDELKPGGVVGQSR